MEDEGYENNKIITRMLSKKKKGKIDFYKWYAKVLSWNLVECIGAAILPFNLKITPRRGR